MKARIRFSKEGKIKFIGHLDLLRLFQRVIKSAGIPIAYSQGFNPHSLLYFAQPLSVGITSSGEYIDLQLTSEVEPGWIQSQMNSILPEGLKIQDVHKLPEDSKGAAAIVDAAEYEIIFDKVIEDEGFIERASDFYNQDEISVTRITKKKERIINIKDFIYEITIKEDSKNYVINVVLATGSSKNLNADLFLQPFVEENKLEQAYHIHRKDLLSLQDGRLISLSNLGE